jgi:Protein of unknown function (DUF2786)
MPADAAVHDLVSPPPESLISRVRKLLAMAEGTSNPNEADAFSLKAAELIAANRIDPERLCAAADDALGVLQLPLGRGAYVRGRLALLQVIGAAHGCRTVFETHDRGTLALVAGFRSDLDSVELLYHLLHAQAASRMAAERRTTAAATQQWRRSFLFGFADQIKAMLQRTSDDAALTLDPSSTALPALRAREQRVDEYAGRRWGRVVAARQVKGATAGGFQAGQHAASRADIGRSRLPGLRAIGRGA